MVWGLGMVYARQLTLVGGAARQFEGSLQTR